MDVNQIQVKDTSLASCGATNLSKFHYGIIVTLTVDPRSATKLEKNRVYPVIASMISSRIGTPNSVDMPNAWVIQVMRT
jgi:hypothetical protein